MSTKSSKLVAQNPLILRCHRLMEAFAKSDDERDYYLDRSEGFLVYIDLDKSQEELDELEQELKTKSDRYSAIPKLTFYEIKKVMEGFVNEKVYDIDTKEKLLDIIGSKDARDNFLEFIYDHHSELEKWQQYYQERFRVRIIEWLRNNQFDFVFEEDLELTKSMVEKLKLNMFNNKAGKDIVSARKILVAKAKTYYSNEALNPRPKRGRPPKQVAKVETEPQFSNDVYTQVPKSVKPFLFVPEYHGSSAIFTFSGKFTSEADLLAHRRQQIQGAMNFDLQNLNQKLQALRSLSSAWNATPDIAAGLKEPIGAPLNGKPRMAQPVAPRKEPQELPEIKKQPSAPMKPLVKTQPKPVKAQKPAPKIAKVKEPVAPKKPLKARLRPLVKKGQKAQAAKPQPAQAKKANLRHLRRSKK